MQTKPTPPIRGSAVWLASLLFVVGCGKKEPAAETAAQPEPSSEAPVQAAAPTPSAQTEAPTELGFDTPEQGLKQTDTALKQGNYDLATDSLLKIQYTGMIQTDKQSWEFNKRMTQLQSGLADAAAAGDAKAQAAIERLKASRRMR